MLISNFFRSIFHANKTYCPICQSMGLGFKPLDNFFIEKYQSLGFKYYQDGEMTAVDTYSCEKCGASDRERLYAHWIDGEFSHSKSNRGQSVIHFAPEENLSRYLRSKIFIDKYITCDLYMEHVDIKANIENLPISNESFDFFICSHVLEHVDNDSVALKELYRITKTGGRGILMVPIVMGIEKTLEDTNPMLSEHDRWRYFGQDDHMRLYAHNDYVKKITDAGFSVLQLGEQSFEDKLFLRLGLKSSSILYIANKL